MSKNNEAYVDWKISNVRNIKGKYGYRITLIYSDNTRKVQQKSGFKSEKECRKARDIAFAQLYSGTYVVDEVIRLREFLETWMETVVKKKKAGTYDTYKSVLKNHIYPRLGNVKLVDLNKGHLTTFYKEVCQVAYTSAKLARVILKTSLRYAVDKKLISESPAENLLLPKKKNCEISAYRTININSEQTLDVEQFKVLLEKSKGTKIYLYILFAGLMGMRKSEIRGLKYSDIDYTRQTIHVQRQLGKDLSKDQSKLPPKTITKQEIALKTRSSDRVLDIPDVVFNAIIEQRKQYEANRRRRPSDFQDLDYICCSSYGRPQSATYASKLYKKLLRENNLPDIRFHDLRHTFATILLKENIATKAVSNALGHAKSIVTVDVYTDMKKIIEEVCEIDETVEEILQPWYLEKIKKDYSKEENGEFFNYSDDDYSFPKSVAEEIIGYAREHIW